MSVLQYAIINKSRYCRCFTALWNNFKCCMKELSELCELSAVHFCGTHICTNILRRFYSNCATHAISTEVVPISGHSRGAQP